MNKLNIIMYHYVRESKNSKFPNIKSLELNDFITESYGEYERKITSLIDQTARTSAKNLIKQKINNPKIFSVKSFTKGFEQTLLKCFS